MMELDLLDWFSEDQFRIYLLSNYLVLLMLLDHMHFQIFCVSELLLTHSTDVVLALSNVFHVLALPILVHLTIMAIQLVSCWEALYALWALFSVLVWDDISYISTLLFRIRLFFL
jgi:hypothetical protein